MQQYSEGEDFSRKLPNNDQKMRNRKQISYSRVCLFVSVRLDTTSTEQSTYVSELTTTTERYSRDQCQASNYHYEALQIHVKEDGIYQFQSISEIYMFGYLYHKTFDPFDPARNLLVENAKRCPTNQLRLKCSLVSSVTYVLVVTTYAPGRTGSFKIQTSGPANITFSRISE